MALALQPCPKTLSAQPQAAHRTATRTNQPSRYLQLAHAGLARAREPLEQQHEGAVGASGGLLQADLAGPVAAQAGAHIQSVELLGDLLERREGQLGVEQAAVSGRPAAGRAGGQDDI